MTEDDSNLRATLVEKLLPFSWTITLRRQLSAKDDLAWEAASRHGARGVAGYGPTIEQALVELERSLAEYLLAESVRALGWRLRESGAMPFPAVLADSPTGQVLVVLARPNDRARAKAAADDEAARHDEATSVVVVPPEAVRAADEFARALVVEGKDGAVAAEGKDSI